MNLIENRVKQIRDWLNENGLKALIIPHADEYLSEYIPPENEWLAWATGFTGSAGLAIITQEKAAIFVDGRYTVQVKEQVDSSLFHILHISNDSYIKWINNTLDSDATVGYDPRLHRADWEKSAKINLEGKITLSAITHNPIDLLWDDRPQPNMEKALLLNEKYTGKSSIDKRREMVEKISTNKSKQ